FVHGDTGRGGTGAEVHACDERMRDAFLVGGIPALDDEVALLADVRRDQAVLPGRFEPVHHANLDPGSRRGWNGGPRWGVEPAAGFHREDAQRGLVQLALEPLL